MQTPESPTQQFATRFGVEPSYYHQDACFSLLRLSMDDIYLVHGLRQMGIAGILDSVQRAATWLFPDGPESISTSYDGQLHMSIDWNKTREKPQPNRDRIAEAFVAGDDEPFRREFSAVAEMLSEISSKNLRWLVDHLFIRSYNGSTDSLLQAGAPILSREQRELVKIGSVVPAEHRVQYPGVGI